MKNNKLSISVLLLSALWIPATAQTDSVSQTASASASKPTIYTVVEKHPEFPGGMARLNGYLRSHLRYPNVAREDRRDGKVFVSFVVSDTGVIQDVKAQTSLGPAFDAEAVRVVADMPPWTPGKQGGKPVNCRYNLPINFSRY